MSDAPAMSETRFVELVGCYGADLMRWPEAERRRAEQLLRDAPHRVRDVWESERIFDMLLALDVEEAPSVELEQRILATSPGPQVVVRRRRWRPEFAPAQWMAGGALAASLAVGFIVGYVGTPAAPTAGPEYAQLLSLSEAGAGEVFFSAVVEPE